MRPPVKSGRKLKRRCREDGTPCVMQKMLKRRIAKRERVLKV